MGKIYKNYLFSIGILVGTVIGAGVFSLPYVFNQSGFFLGAVYLLLMASIYALVYLMYSDVILNTEEKHRFPGYAKIYLGKSAYGLGIFTGVISAVFVLTIYLVLSTSFIRLITDAGTDPFYALLFWTLGSLVIFLDVDRMGFLELFVTLGMIAIIGAIFMSSFSNPAGEISFGLPEGLSKILLPLAPVLFALGGRTAIALIVEHYGDNEDRARLVKRSIIIGMALSAVIFLAFSLGVARTSGTISEDAVTGLVGFAPEWLLVAMGFLGLAAIFSSYIISGLNIKNILEKDLSLSPSVRTLIVVGGPVILYLIGFNQFLLLISVAGGILGIFEPILIIAMWRKVKLRFGSERMIGRASLITIASIMLVFIVTFVYQVINLS
jgi:amino acid permease